MPERLVATHRRLVATAVGLSLLLSGSYALTGWSVYTSHRTACAARDKTLDVIRDILMDAQGASPATASASRFYAVEFARIRAARC